MMLAYVVSSGESQMHRINMCGTYTDLNEDTHFYVLHQHISQFYRYCEPTEYHDFLQENSCNSSGV